MGVGWGWWGRTEQEVNVCYLAKPVDILHVSHHHSMKMGKRVKAGFVMCNRNVLHELRFLVDSNCRLSHR